MESEDFWAVANNLYTVITHRDESDSWRDSVIDILKAVHSDGYWEGRA